MPASPYDNSEISNEQSAMFLRYNDIILHEFYLFLRLILKVQLCDYLAKTLISLSTLVSSRCHQIHVLRSSILSNLSCQFILWCFQKWKGKDFEWSKRRVGQLNKTCLPSKEINIQKFVNFYDIISNKHCIDPRLIWVKNFYLQYIWKYQHNWCSSESDALLNIHLVLWPNRFHKNIPA